MPNPAYIYFEVCFWRVWGTLLVGFTSHSRWHSFAETPHPSTLYYGRSPRISCLSCSPTEKLNSYHMQRNVRRAMQLYPSSKEYERFDSISCTCTIHHARSRPPHPSLSSCCLCTHSQDKPQNTRRPKIQSETYSLTRFNTQIETAKLRTSNISTFRGTTRD